MTVNHFTDYASAVGADGKLHCWHYTDGETTVTYTNHGVDGASPTYRIETSGRWESPRQYIETMAKNVGVWPVPADFWKVAS